MRVGDERLGAQVLDLLSSLVDKSLVMREDVGGVAGYRLHETMREYAEAQVARGRRGRTLSKSGASSTTGPGAWHLRTRLGTASLEWLVGRAGDRQHPLGSAEVPARLRLAASGFEIATSIGYYWINARDHGEQSAGSTNCSPA